MSAITETKRCCGTCEHHKCDKESANWVCDNPNSDYCTYWTDYNDWCYDYEERSK